MSKIKDLIPDDRNYNNGNEFGNSLIEKSLRKLGAGRSILIDKNNRIIAGNKTVENAVAIGLEDMQIVESDGTKIIAVKRTDIDLDSKKGRELALADNASAKANIVWNHENLKEDWGDDELKGWGIEIDEPNENIPAKTDLVEKPSYHSRVGYGFISLFKKSKAGVELSKIKEPQYFDRIAFLFCDLVAKHVRNTNTCIVCPPARRHKDYNLAQELVKYCAAKIGAKYEIDLFEAIGLQKIEPNIALKKNLDFDNYIIIDDILTTGSTVQKIVELLSGKNFMVFVAINNN